MRKVWGASGWRPHLRFARNLVDLFFMEIYHNQCEDLPENMHIEDVEAMFSSDKLPEEVGKVYSWTPEVALSERVAHFVGPDAAAPVRHLPPGKPITLFWQLKAWSSAISTFH